MIKPERTTLRVLERRVDRFLPEELELYFDDIIDAVERIWDQLDNYKEVVEALESTNESVISHRQNDVLRLLTIISVTMLPLTLITGIFGMNVALPGRGDARRRSGSSSARCVATLGGDDRLLPLEALDLARLACLHGFRRVGTRTCIPEQPAAESVRLVMRRESRRWEVRRRAATRRLRLRRISSG